MEMPNRKPNRIAGYDYSQSGAYFITICTQDRKKILSRISVGTPLPGCPQEPCVELLWHGEVADKYIRQMDAFYEHLSVDQYIIMPDHIHLLVTIHGGHPGTGVPTRTSEIARFVGTFKRFCNKEYGNKAEKRKDGKEYFTVTASGREAATMLEINSLVFASD